MGKVEENFKTGFNFHNETEKLGSFRKKVLKKSGPQKYIGEKTKSIGMT